MADTLNPWKLSPRESQVFDKLCIHGNNKRIARDLSISEKTVERHIENAYEKFQIRNRVAAAIKWAIWRHNGDVT